MDNIVLEALKKLLPETDVNEVYESVKTVLEEKNKELENEFDTKLQEAYAELSKQLEETENKAKEGYSQAYAIIAELRNRLDLQREEYEKEMHEGFEQAYQQIKLEEEKNKTIEIDMYEQYDSKLEEMKEYMVDKLDEFFKEQVSQIYQQARRDILNDPRLAEHKVALDKIVDITANYLSDHEVAGVTSEKLSEAAKEIENMKGQLKILEARNIRLSTDNTKLNEVFRQIKEENSKLNEAVKETKKVILENKNTAVVNEQKERIKKAANVTGNGSSNAAATDGGIILENNEHSQLSDELLALAGLKKGRK
jgi:hypothetical protein